jgi:Family of unknown function (DUF6931)
MSQVRFATARDVFEAFTVAPSSITVGPTDDPPLDFLRTLVSKGKLEDAIAFCGYLLPRREAVWWACRSVRALGGVADRGSGAGLSIAEAWVQDPSSQRRKTAEEFAGSADRDDPMTWLARAAAWSGGAIRMGAAQAVAPPPELTAHAARAAILLSARFLEPAERRSRLVACIDDGARLAETGL